MGKQKLTYYRAKKHIATDELQILDDLAVPH
jgi:hypothetical protein